MYALIMIAMLNTGQVIENVRVFPSYESCKKAEQEFIDSADRKANYIVTCRRMQR